MNKEKINKLPNETMKEWQMKPQKHKQMNETMR